MLIELDKIHDKVGITFIYVTHDQQEALSVSDRVAVFNEGVIRQVGTPLDIYENPADAFVANFIGETNFISGTVTAIRDTGMVRVEADRIGPVWVESNRQLQAGAPVKVTVRPEKIRIAPEPPTEHGEGVNVLTGTVDEIIYSGFQSKYFINAGATLFRVFKQHLKYHPDEKPIGWKEQASIWWSAADSYIVESDDR